jgi:hypothetical protein
MDGDLSFGPDYFAKCVEHFQKDPKLGVGGGYLYHLTNGKRELIADSPSSRHGVGLRALGRRR